MSDYPTIFKVRSNLDPARQPSLRHLLSDLTEALSGENPYERTKEVRSALMSLRNFSVGAGGRPAPLPPDDHIFRLTSLSNLQRFTTRWKEDDEVSLQISLGQLMNKSAAAKSTQNWLPLSDVAEGVLTSERSFTWWSSLPVRLESVICDLHERGMPNDWVSPYSVLLRCPISKLRGINILFEPSVLDGFDSVIFEAAHENREPNCGNSISIEIPTQLKQGASEYVLKPLPVEYIDILPIMIDETMRRHKVHELDVHKSLHAYYEEQLNR